MIHRSFTLLAAVLASLSGCTPQAEAPAVPETAGSSGSSLLSAQQVKDAQLSIESIEERDLPDEVIASGKVTFDDLRVSHVFSPVTGRVTRILAQLGQRVKKGDALAAIESPDVGSALSDLSKAQADLIAAEHDFKRQKDLVQSHAGAEKDLEQSEDNDRKAQAEMQRAQQKARLLRRGSIDEVLQEYTLRALIDGEVIARSVNPGAEVQGQYSGGTSTELFTVGEIDSVWIMADIFEMDLGKVQPGAHASVRVVAYPDRTFEGVVDWVSDALDPLTRTGKVRITLANPDHLLKPEMYATVTLEGPSHRALAVRRTAVVRLGEQTVVYVQAGASPNGAMRFERRPVRVDEELGRDFVPVLHGLSAGDQVVTSGAILLTES